MNSHTSRACASAFCLIPLAGLALAQEKPATPDATQQAVLNMAKQVRKQIVTQAQYGVFDSIHFAI